MTVIQTNIKMLNLQISIIVLRLKEIDLQISEYKSMLYFFYEII